MKKLLSILFLSLCIAACSKDDTPKPEMDETVKQIWQTLNGRYIGFHEDKLSSAGSYTETIVFQPYSEPETIPIRFILGLLNSKLLRYYFGFIGVMTAGGAYTLKASTIEALPIAIGTKKQQKEIALKVENILNAKAKNKQIDVSLNEHEIDCLVYNLYGLSEKEIKIVEGV